MRYKIIPTKIFLERLRVLSPQANCIILDKIEFLKSNPFRYKSLSIDKNVFRIRISDKRRQLRSIYQVVKDKVILISILNRKDDYNDLQKSLDEVEETCRKTI